MPPTQAPSNDGRAGSPWLSLLGDLLKARATLVLLAVGFTVQLALELAGGWQENQGGLEWVGLSWEKFSDLRFWQLGTYAFFHGTWWHFAMNGFLLAAFGSRVERIGGAGWVIKLWTAGVLLGGLAYLLLAPRGEAGPYLVGASGGVFALLLWLTGVSPESRMWPLPVSGRSLGLGVLLASGILAVVDPGLGIPGLAGIGRLLDQASGGALFDISHACHLGGAVAGLVAARWTLRPRITLDSLQRDRARREEAGAVQAKSTPD